MTILPQIPTLSACSPPQSLCPNNGLSAVPQTSYTDCCLGPFNVCSNCQDCPSPRCALGLLLHPFVIVVSIRCFQFVSSYFHLNAFQSGVHLHLSTEIALAKIMNNFHLVQSNGLICSPCLTRPISSIWHTDESLPLILSSSLGFQDITFSWFPLTLLTAPSQSPLMAPPLLPDILKWECPWAQSLFFFSFLSILPW